jgi:glycosyltransferase involved in cell wall biosynthesis
MGPMTTRIGIYNLHMQAMGGGEKLTLVLAEHLSLKHDVSLFCAEHFDTKTLENYFDVDLSRVTVSPLKNSGSIARAVAKIRGDNNTDSSHYQQLRDLNLDLFINNSYGSKLISPNRRGIFMCMFPHASLPAADDALASYSTVIAISEFSANWVRQKWKRDPEIIYPPCDDMGPPHTKEKLILHVGRFLADSDEDERHHKGQALLLETFKSLTDLHQSGWQLHFAGSLSADKRSKQFADALLKSARGFPVSFHFNSPREQLRDLYRKAAIYWHATGYGSDSQYQPFKQEHFGISTVEAMSAACVPVVYSSGGQTEIVKNRLEGFWWNDLDELKSQTRTLANNSQLRSELGQQAAISSKRFGREAFGARIDQLIDALLS